MRATTAFTVLTNIPRSIVTYERTGGLTRAECLALVRSGVTFLRGRELHADPQAIAAIALNLGLSAYDAWYVALAPTLQGVLVTEDQPLLSRAPAMARSLEGYS